MTNPKPDLDFERDFAIDDEARAALDHAREVRVDPAKLKWEWVSLARQFPNLQQDRSTSEGWEEFYL